MKRILLVATAAFALAAPASAAKHHPRRAVTAEVPPDQALVEGYHRASRFEQIKT